MARPQTSDGHSSNLRRLRNMGCGAYCGKEWFMVPWTAMYIHHRITVKELAPIVVSALVWGNSWRGKTVLSRCDNAAVVAIINSGSSKNPTAMNLLRCLAYLCATKEFRIYATHINGVCNTLPDALSRNNLPLFLSHYPQENQVATHIPAEVLDAVMLQEPDWTAKNWIVRWNSTWTTL